MTIAKGSRGWLLCWRPRRSMPAVWASAQEQRKVRRTFSPFPGGEGWQVGVKASGVNSSLAVKPSSLALVTCKRLPQDGKEEKEGATQRDSETLPRAERSEESGQPLWALACIPGCAASAVCGCCVLRKQLRATVCTWWLMWRGVKSLKRMHPSQGQSPAFSALSG